MRSRRHLAVTVRGGAPYADPVTLAHLALSRSTLDRAAHRREHPDLVARLLRDPRTQVLIMVGDQAPVRDLEDRTALALRPAPEVAHLAEAANAVAFLGEEHPADDGRGDRVDHLVIALPAGPEVPPEATPAVDGRTRLATLREVGSLLDDTGAGVLATSLALANWHANHPRCSRCGAVTDVVHAGWSRRCEACGAAHFPRTDPAVIMSVIDPDDRILLGHQAVWPPKRFSTLAGFVEPGESLEAAVRREVHEEAGVDVGAVTYQGSQPWPFPCSLMLAFRAEALSTDVVVDGDELADARWWSREELALDIATGELLLPPPVSVARQLIESWYGGPIRDTGGTWR